MSDLVHSQDFHIRLRQGVGADIDATATVNTAIEGEPHWTTDTYHLFIYSDVLDEMVPIQTLDMALIDEDFNVMVSEDFSILYEA